MQAGRDAEGGRAVAGDNSRGGFCWPGKMTEAGAGRRDALNSERTEADCSGDSRWPVAGGWGSVAGLVRYDAGAVVQTAPSKSSEGHEDEDEDESEAARTETGCVERTRSEPEVTTAARSGSQRAPVAVRPVAWLGGEREEA